MQKFCDYLDLFCTSRLVFAVYINISGAVKELSMQNADNLLLSDVDICRKLRLKILKMRSQCHPSQLLYVS